jgi:hypothetical protein
MRKVMASTSAVFVWQPMWMRSNVSPGPGKNANIGTSEIQNFRFWAIKELSGPGKSQRMLSNCHGIDASDQEAGKTTG